MLVGSGKRHLHKGAKEDKHQAQERAERQLIPISGMLGNQRNLLSFHKLYLYKNPVRIRLAPLDVRMHPKVT